MREFLYYPLSVFLQLLKSLFELPDKKGVDKIRLYRAVNPQSEQDFKLVAEDASAPFTCAQDSQQLSPGDILAYRAIATDIDGYQSALSAERRLTVVADKPPQASIVQPATDNSFVIRGQTLDVFIEVTDDLGLELALVGERDQHLVRLFCPVADHQFHLAAGRLPGIFGAALPLQVER